MGLPGKLLQCGFLPGLPDCSLLFLPDSIACGTLTMGSWEGEELHHTWGNPLTLPEEVAGFLSRNLHQAVSADFFTCSSRLSGWRCVNHASAGAHDFFIPSHILGPSRFHSQTPLTRSRSMVRCQFFEIHAQAMGTHCQMNIIKGHRIETGAWKNMQNCSGFRSRYIHMVFPLD